MSEWKQERHRQMQRASSSAGLRCQLADLCLKIVDLGLGGVIFVGPHLFGGRHFLGRFAILSLCVVAALAWCVRQLMLEKPKWTRTPALGILLTALAWVAFQLTPLPSAWLDCLAPQLAELLPLWNGATSGISLGQWQTLSLSPEDTRLALATLIAYGLLFVTAVQRLETFEDVKRITRWIALSAVIVAGFGVIQYFTANGKFFWFYDHPYAITAGDLKAGFTSRNHCAHFLVLGFANLFAWIMLERNQNHANRPSSVKHRGFAREQSPAKGGAVSLALTAAAMLLVFAILATLSRGGILAMVSALGVSACIYARAHLLNSNHFLVGAVLLFLLFAVLSFSGSYEKLAHRMDSLTTTSVEELDDSRARRKIWSANIDAFHAHQLAGWGAGCHRFVYPLFIGEPTTTEYTHAENGYLQIATEHGLAGLFMLGAVMTSCTWWCLRAIKATPNDRALGIVGGGIAGGLAASAAHSIVDFVWFIPACMSITILLAACALRLAQIANEPTRHPSYQSPMTSLTRFNMAFATALAGLWAVHAMYPAAVTSLNWDAYLRADQVLQIAAATRPSASESQRTEIQESEALNGAASLENLALVVRDYPNSARAHARLCSNLLKRFEELQQQSDNAMTIGQIREAANASHFVSRQALRDWLTRAFGKNCKLLYLARTHAYQALQLCPLQGEAYLFLAELAFLDGNGPAGYTAYANQALRVRPDDADVQFTIGKNNLVAGKVDEALHHWALAYRGTGKHQFHTIQILAGRMPAANFLQVFAPDWRTLGILWANYKQAGTLDDLRAILPYAQERAKQQTGDMYATRAGKVWHDLGCMQLEMDDPRGALESLQHAYAAFPESVNTRRQLGKCLMIFQQYELAEQHLRWCTQQYPDNPIYRAELLQATRGKMQQLARSSQPSVK